ncbi:MAG: response regulator [Pseudobdellovibrionaceae bacterium]
MKILVVDDEPLVRRSLERVLKTKGYNVIGAQDGNEGLEKWRAEDPDLVFLDVLMPGLSGPQVLREIGNGKRAKVILMSAYAGEHNMETALQMGADLFIPKPFEDIFSILTTAEELMK